MLQQAVPFKEFTSRVETREGVWVDWRCIGREDISRVRNLAWWSVCRDTDAKGSGFDGQARISCPEGQIRADAVVRVRARWWIRMKFTAVSEEDRPV